MRKDTPVEARPGEALVWTDGACSGNPGPGGWAAIVVPAAGGEPVELSGGEPHTTNNRMELTAALEGLRALPAGSRAVIVTDSFRATADAMAELRGAPGYRYATTAHPVAVLTQDQVKQRAAAVLDDVVALLTS